MIALPRLPAAAARALAAAGLTTLEDVVAVGRTVVDGLEGIGREALVVLDEAVVRAGLCEAEPLEALAS